MVNWVAAQEPLLLFIAKLAGLHRRTIDLEPGTAMSFWVPKKSDKRKPPLVLIHGFAGDGLVTWQFQIGYLSKKYAVYVPDLLFFGGSTTESKERTPEFQANCLGRALERLGVQRCSLAGFSYGGMVAFKLAEAKPEMVMAMVISGSVLAMRKDIEEEITTRLGFESSADMLLPRNAKGNKKLLSVATYKKFWFPTRLHKDYVEVMYGNRKEKEELLRGLEICQREFIVPSNLPQHVFLLWGECDGIFKIDLAKDMKEKLGEKASLHAISKAGHLVHLERPCVYNRSIKGFLDKIYYPKSYV